MDKGERFRLVIIVSYVLLVICAVILLVNLWNHLSMNPSVYIGNRLYFLVFAILILASILFVLHLAVEYRGSSPGKPEEPLKQETAERAGSISPESLKVPFEVDIDLLAENIVPRTDRRESLSGFAERILHNLASHFEIGQGIFYLKNPRSQEFEFLCAYAYASEKNPPAFKSGDGIPGQAARSRTILSLASLPEGYIQIQSGLGKSPPRNLVVIPLLLNRETIGIIELASFHPMDEETEWTYRNLSKIIGNAIVAKMKSDGKP